MCVNVGGDRERVVGVAFGLLGFTLSDRHASPRPQRHGQVPAPHHRDGLVGPLSRRDQIAACQSNLGHGVDIH